MTDEIKVGDTVRVSKEAPNMYDIGGNLINKQEFEVIDETPEFLEIKLANGPRYAVHRAYLVKVGGKEKELRFKVNDVVRTVFNEITHVTSVLGNGNYYLYGMGNEYPEDSLTLVEPYTEPTEEKKDNTITIPVKAEIDDSFWDAYTADLAKEIAIVYAKQKREVRLAVRDAKSVVEELKKK